MSQDFFPPRPASRPTIYSCEDTNPQHAGLHKVGYRGLGGRPKMRN